MVRHAAGQQKETRGHARARRGLTMLEILIASVVLVIGLLGMLQVVANSARAVRTTEQRARSLMFARSKLEEILHQPTINVGDERGQGQDTNADYDWEAIVEQTQSGSLVLVTVIAKDRATGFSNSISALRRPDIQNAPDTSNGTSPTGGSQ